MTVLNKYAAYMVFVLCLIPQGRTQNTLTCWTQKMLSKTLLPEYCPPKELECSLNNFVTEAWFDDDLEQSVQNLEEPISFACITLFAFNSRKEEAPLQTVKGCADAIATGDLCKLFMEKQKARGMTDSECLACTENHCNSINTFNSRLNALPASPRLASSANTTSCWQQRSREGPASELDGPGNQVRCEPRGSVSLVWLDAHEQQTILGPNTSEGFDYVCLKLTASNPKIAGDSTDVIRGCALANAAKNLCNALIETELARDKKDVHCDICTGDYCNSAVGINVSAVTLLVSVFLAKFLNH